MPGRCRRNLTRTFAGFILLAAGSLDPVLAASPEAPHITEPRNAATGFAITLWMTQVDALGQHCARLGEPARLEFAPVLEAWQHRNAPYVNAALEYLADIEDYISATRGEAARKEFRAARSAEFAGATRESEAVWFPDGRIDEESCRRLANQMASGSLDLDRNAEFFPILQGLSAEAGRKATPVR